VNARFASAIVRKSDCKAFAWSASAARSISPCSPSLSRLQLPMTAQTNQEERQKSRPDEHTKRDKEKQKRPASLMRAV
jgi:hypothetical protein